MVQAYVVFQIPSQRVYTHKNSPKFVVLSPYTGAFSTPISAGKHIFIMEQRFTHPTFPGEFAQRCCSPSMSRGCGLKLTRPAKKLSKQCAVMTVPDREKALSAQREND